MQSKSQIQSLLADRGLRPRRRFGQCFLHDKNQLGKLIDAAAVTAGEVVLEVGPGTGTLTEALLEAGAEVVAVEIDRDLAAICVDRFDDRITLVVDDCLERGRRLSRNVVAAIGGRPFKLVANLPYQIASPLIVTLLLEREPRCTGMFVTIQQEVSQRLLAEPGTKSYGPLGITVQALAEVASIGIVPASCFWPAPEVTSAMVRITPRAEAAVEDPAHFAAFIKDLFSKRRKQLGGIFGRDRTWPAGIDPTHRPERLSVTQLVTLCHWSGAESR